VPFQKVPESLSINGKEWTELSKREARRGSALTTVLGAPLYIAARPSLPEAQVKVRMLAIT